MNAIDAKLKMQTELHAQWLKHPETQTFLNILENRLNKQTKELQEGILVESNVDKETKYRCSISAIKATITIAKDTEVFIMEENKLTPNK